LSAVEASERRVFVWDAATRVFHWALAALVVIAWFTGEGEGSAAAIHRGAGAGIAGLILFRVIWGFIGGEHARFADFAFAPRAALFHARRLIGGRAERHLGHNPLGAIAVYLLLLNIILIVATGLMSAGEVNAGPFAGAWARQFAELHEGAFRVLQGLVALHLLGVLIETIFTKDALIPAMITGHKRRRVDESGADARKAGFLAFALATAAGAALAAGLMAPVSAPTNAGAADAAEQTDD
jgi:cytochrome b